MVCNNCNTNFESKYCSNCGQKSAVGELTLKDLFHEFWHSITHTDRGVLKLIKDLAVRPKQVYLGYFSGQRKTYFSPVTFFILAATLVLLIGEKVFDYEDFVRAPGNPNGFNEYGRYILKSTKFDTLIALPFVVFFTWLFFRKRFNLAKITVFYLYANGFFFCVQLLYSPLYFAFIYQKEVIDSFITFTCYALLVWHLIVVFANRKWTNYVAVFLILNFVHILNNLIAYYVLLGDKIFVATKTENIFGLIKVIYGQ